MTKGLQEALGKLEERKSSKKLSGSKAIAKHSSNMTMASAANSGIMRKKSTRKTAASNIQVPATGNFSVSFPAKQASANEVMQEQKPTPEPEKKPMSFSELLTQ